ncbi:hypothetical protein BDZ45DRAFT_802636 [Acephala macrosclerotiorum]|nr:hypothetical protein BDZ45DRAFT_802636 [Acephala macrosclerotiorum]
MSRSTLSLAPAELAIVWLKAGFSLPVPIPFSTIGGAGLDGGANLRTVLLEMPSFNMFHGLGPPPDSPDYDQQFVSSDASISASDPTLRLSSDDNSNSLIRRSS